jgi:hypothetical protein
MLAAPEIDSSLSLIGVQQQRGCYDGSSRYAPQPRWVLDR